MTHKITLGKSIHPLLKQEVELEYKDFKNTLIFGSSQTKITDLIQNLTIQVMEQKTGAIIFDLNDDFNDDFLSNLPADLQSKIEVFDPLHIEGIPGLNLMDIGDNKQPDANQITLIISKIWQIVDRIYDLKATGGPIFESYFINTIKLAMCHTESGASLALFSRVLRDEDFRTFKLAMCDDKRVVNFWEEEAVKAGGDASFENMVPYISSKLSPFLNNSIVANIVSQQKSTINFKNIIEQNKILFIRLNKSKIGHEAQNVISMLLLAKFELDLADYRFNTNSDKPTIIIPSLEQIIENGVVELVSKYSDQIRFIFTAKSSKSLNLNTKDYYSLIHDHFPNLIEFRDLSNPKTKSFTDNQALFNFDLGQKFDESIILEIATPVLEIPKQATVEKSNFYLKGGMTESEINAAIENQGNLFS